MLNAKKQIEWKNAYCAIKPLALQIKVFYWNEAKEKAEEKNKKSKAIELNWTKTWINVVYFVIHNYHNFTIHIYAYMHTCDIKNSCL